jgi:hypothetical protein
MFTATSSSVEQSCDASAAVCCIKMNNVWYNCNGIDLCQHQHVCSTLLQPAAAAAVAAGVSPATVRDLSEGTTRACRHLPGYTGFVPAAAVNEAAVQQAAGTTIRPDAKVGAVDLSSMRGCAMAQPERHLRYEVVIVGMHVTV